MSAICDDCMSRFTRAGIPPHSEVFGPNGMRREQHRCEMCLREDVACVDRPDFSTPNGIAHWKRQP
jgi:hypothetical protein